MWKFLNPYRNLGMEGVYMVVHAKGNDIDFQRSKGCSELNRADLPPCCCYLHFPWLRLIKSKKRWLISSPH